MAVKGSVSPPGASYLPRNFPGTSLLFSPEQLPAPTAPREGRSRLVPRSSGPEAQVTLGAGRAHTEVSLLMERARGPWLGRGGLHYSLHGHPQGLLPPFLADLSPRERPVQSVQEEEKVRVRLRPLYGTDPPTKPHSPQALPLRGLDFQNLLFEKTRTMNAEVFS